MDNSLILRLQAQRDFFKKNIMDLYRKYGNDYLAIDDEKVLEHDSDIKVLESKIINLKLYRKPLVTNISEFSEEL